MNIQIITKPLFVSFSVISFLTTSIYFYLNPSHSIISFSKPLNKLLFKIEELE